MNPDLLIQSFNNNNKVKTILVSMLATVTGMDLVQAFGEKQSQ